MGFMHCSQTAGRRVFALIAAGGDRDKVNDHVLIVPR